MDDCITYLRDIVTNQVTPYDVRTRPNPSRERPFVRDLIN